jgi:hypothetical protein
MKILAFPTPTNILNTIGEAPSHRPLGRTGGYEFQAQPNDPTPQSCINKKAYNSRGYTGTRASKFIQDNQFLPVDRAPGVYPLSTPGTEGLGNVGDSAPQPRPGFAQPLNGDFQNILNILNNPDGGLGGSNMSAGQVRLLAERREKLTRKPEAGSSAGVQVATDFANTRKVMMKEQRIRNAEAQGFTREEAEQAYSKLRDREAEVALGTQESVAHRLTDLVDSRLGGTQNGEYRNNDESALYLAQNTTIAPHLTVKEIIAKRTFSSKVVPQISEGVYLRRTTPFVNNLLLQDTTTGRGILPPQVSTPRPKLNTGLFLRGEVQNALIRNVQAVSDRPAQALAAQSRVAEIVEGIAKRRGRPPGSKDKAPRERPSGIPYKKRGDLPADFSGDGRGGRA